MTINSSDPSVKYEAKHTLPFRLSIGLQKLDHLDLFLQHVFFPVLLVQLDSLSHSKGGDAVRIGSGVCGTCPFVVMALPKRLLVVLSLRLAVLRLVVLRWWLKRPSPSTRTTGALSLPLGCSPALKVLDDWKFCNTRINHFTRYDGVKSTIIAHYVFKATEPPV